MSVDWWAIAGTIAITAASAAATLYANRLQRRDQARHQRHSEEPPSTSDGGAALR